MSGEELARTFLEATRGYVEPTAPGAETKSYDRPVKLGTVDSAFAGAPARPRVLFDGESLLGLRTYAWVGIPPRAGERVVLVPQGHTFVIVGTLETVPGAGLPAGTSLEGHWSAAPLGFLLEDGAVVLRATYPALFAALGTRYNTGGETAAQFRLPDSRGRVAVPKAAAGTFGTLGATGGAEAVVLTEGQVPRTTTSRPVNTTAFETDGSNAPLVAGSGTRHKYADVNDPPTAHNNLQPYIVVTRVIKT